MGWLIDEFKREAEEVQKLWRLCTGGKAPEPEELPPPEESTAEPHVAALDNGLKTAIQYAPGALRMSEATLLINAGSARDPAGKEGLAHFLEHVVCGRALEEEIKKRGGELYAATSGSDIQLGIQIPYSPENEEFMLKTLKDMATNRNLLPSLIEKERKRILNEIGQSNDDPKRRLNNETAQLMYSMPGAYTGNLGPRENVRTITREDMIRFMDSYFTAANMTLAVKTPEPPRAAALAQEVKKIYGGIPRGTAAEPVPISYTPYEKRADHGTEQLHFSYVVPVTDPTKEDFYTQVVYDNYVGMLARRDLIDSGLVYDAGAHCGLRPGILAFTGVTGNVMPEDADKVGPAAAKILGQTAHIIDPEIFAQAKQYVMQQFRGDQNDWLRNQGTYDMARSLADTGKTQTAWENFQGLDKVTADDLKAFARDKVLVNRPSVYAAGKSDLLLGQDAFEAQLRQHAAPGADAALGAQFQPAVA